MLWNIGFFIIAIVILVSFHEWGHYLFARLFKVKIITFSVGFGQKLFSWTNKKGTDFIVAAIPLGGFVRMAGSKEKDENDLPLELAEGEVYYDTLPPLKRIVISLAGPLFNFILAFLIYSYVFLFPISQQDLVFDEVVEQSVFSQANISGSFEILKVNGRSFENKRELRLYLYLLVGKKTTITVEYKQYGQILNTELLLDDLKINSPLGIFGQLGLDQKELGYQVLTAFVADGPAKLGGMQKGDIWYSINDRLIDSALKWQLGIQEGGIQKWEVIRDGSLVELSIKPIQALDVKDSPYSIGVRVQSSADSAEHIYLQEFTFIESILYGFKYTFNMIEFNIISIVKLIKGEIGLNNLGGPGTMADASGTAAKSGILSFLSLLGILSISLGVINLMPVPMLDGGNVLFDSIELIRRKALSESWQMRFRAFGLFFVLSVMVMAITNDVYRYL